MKITNPVYQTHLFASVAPYINSIPPEILALELAKTHVKNGEMVNFNAGDLDGALTWNKSTQGSDFWSKLYDECYLNSRNNEIVSNIEHLINEHLGD